MKRNFADELVRQALGRILRDAPAAGDGNLLLEALENVRETVSPRLPDASALQAEWGRRNLAQHLIEIGREEFERVTTQASLSDSGTSTRFGSASGASLREPSPIAAVSASRIASRRRGPRYSPEAS